MAMFKGHILGAIIFYAAVVFFFSLGSYGLINNISWFIATLAGALFPDIDISSKGQHLYLKVLALLFFLCLFFQAFVPLVMLLAMVILSVFVPHRSLFHDLRFIMAVTAIVAIGLLFLMPAKTHLIVSSSLFFLLGVLSHLLLDKGIKGTF